MNSEDPILIYRILHIENVVLLTTRGGLHAPSKAPNDGLVYRAIHSQAIQSQRGGRRVPCGPGGSVQDYVSFYFGCRGPMLLQIATGRVPGVDEDQNRVVYAVSSVESIRAYGLPFVFTDGHSLANFTAWFETLEDLTALDWDTIGTRSWHDTLDDPDRQRRKQAEILVHEFVPLKALLGFAAMTREARDEVQTKLLERGVELPVAVRREWYY